jgi:predicted ATPase
MYTPFELANVLHQLMRRPNLRYTPGLVSKLSGVPKATIVNWLEGQVRKPRRWQDLVRVADAMRLSMDDATRLLQSAGHPPVEVLLAQTERPQDRVLLAGWVTDARSMVRTARAPGPRLPAASDSFVGRVRELTALKALLRRDDVRLVTLTGPGGSGKTRLALRLAADLTNKDSVDPLLPQPGVLRAQELGDISSEGARIFLDRACFVPLGLVRDPALVAAAIGQALGVTELDNRTPAERLREELGDQQLLLVLDNFEHLTVAAPLIAELLAAVPLLKVLVTSRVVLRLTGEQIFSVPPLALPPQEPRAGLRRVNQAPALVGQDSIHDSQFPVLASVAALTQYDAVRLFVERAKAVNPDFQLTEANAPYVAAICVRLDGLPLAIELAAARSRLLDPQALLDRLGRQGESALQLLTGGAQDRPARQQTLRDTLAWSYNQLDIKTQHLFRRLAIFAGGATLEAIEAITSELRIENGELKNAAHERLVFIFPFSILNSLEALVDHSLLASQTSATSERRFAMLETIREYALEQLEASGELEVIRRRHAICYLELAERAAPKLLGQHQVEWLARIDAEYANLRSALEWFTLHDGATGLRLVNALFEFWKIRSQFVEGHAWFARILAQAPQPTSLRAEALARAGMLLYTQGNYPAASALHTESLAIRRRLNDLDGIAYSLNLLGHVAAHQGNYATAHACFEESRSKWRQLDHKGGMAMSHEGLGRVFAHEGDYAHAVEHYRETLRLMRELGRGQDIAIALNNLGTVLRSCGEHTHAAQLYAESLPLFQTVGDREGIAWYLYNLGHLALAEGQHDLAGARFAASLALCRELGSRLGIAYCLAGFGALAVAQERHMRAARLLGAVEELLDTLRSRMNATDQATYQRSAATTRAQLDAGAFDEAWVGGRALTLDEAIAEALGEQL